MEAGLGAPADGGGVSLTVALADWLAGAGAAPGVTGRIFKVLVPGDGVAAASGAGASGAGGTAAGAMASGAAEGAGAVAGSEDGLAAAPGRMMLIFIVGEAPLAALGAGGAGASGGAGVGAGAAGVGAGAASGASGAGTFKVSGAAAAA